MMISQLYHRRRAQAQELADKVRMDKRINWAKVELVPNNGWVVAISAKPPKFLRTVGPFPTKDAAQAAWNDLSREHPDEDYHALKFIAGSGWKFMVFEKAHDIYSEYKDICEVRDPITGKRIRENTPKNGPF